MLRRINKFIVRHLLFFILLLVKTLSAEQVFIDEIGENVRLEGVPARIVSLAPSITETLFAIGAGEMVVGVTDFCDYPEETKRKERVGGFINPSIEKILFLKPDLVFATRDGNDQMVVNRLKRSGIPVYVADQRDFNGVLESIRKISLILGVDKAGMEITNELERRKKDIENKVKHKRRVLFLYSTEPLIASGPKTLANDLIKIAGGINIFEDSRVSYPRVNLETAITRKPDVVIVTTMADENNRNLTKLEKFFRSRVRRINGDIVNRPGPRIIEGLEELYRIIHEEPE